MSIAWVYCLAYNEHDLIGYWVRHFQTFCEKVVVNVDSDTTDDTAEIALSEGAEVRIFASQGFDDFAFADFANEQYKETIGKADWVIWTDADEILYHPTINQRLDDLYTAGVNLPHSDYYAMVSDGLPTHTGQIYDSPQFRKGVLVGHDVKTAIFNPNTIKVHWGIGKHLAVVDRVPVQDTGQPFKLLHYRWLGPENLHKRDARNFERMTKRMHERNISFHVRPEFTGPYDSGWTDQRPEDAVDVLS